jgi:hypothetical protein
MHCLYSSLVALSVLLCTIGVQGKGPCLGHYPMSLRPFAGLYVPQCTPFGYFKVVQVHGSTGHSWCVNPETGAKVESSDVAPGAGQPQCGKCFYELAKFLGAGFVSIPGRVKPQCDENGLFTAKQFSGSTGYSWCVDPETGDKIQGTDIAPGAGEANCEHARQTRGATDGPCNIFRIACGKRSMPGCFEPQCTDSGYFQIIQRHSSTGYRFCVNPETGDKIDGTEVPPNSNAIPQCGKCLYALAQYHASPSTMVTIGRPHPSCDAQGLFNAKQFSGSSGYTWCVDPETGDKIEGTEVAPAAGQADCRSRQKRGFPGPCTQKKDEQSLLLGPPIIGGHIIGRYVPQCTIFGYFQVVQTHGSTGYSFCVNPETGAKVEGSDVRGTPNCGKCLYDLAKTFVAGPIGPVRPPGSPPRPQCDETGNYSPVQYSGSTGYSWCVDPATGVKIEGTDVAPGAGPASCGSRQKRGLSGPCTAHKSTPGLIGAYVPQCTIFGFYKVVQTHGSTGFSFCVNPETGVKVEGSDVRGTPTCPKCLTDLAHTFVGGPIGPVRPPGSPPRPQCDETGNYSPVQYSGSTGYSWCVDPATGVKIEGTDVAPGAGPASCGSRQKRGLPGPCTAHKSTPGLIGAYVPQCTIFGFYKVVQTHGSTGFSFCVNPETGAKVEGSDVRGTPTCGKCLYDLAKTFVAGPIGPVRPPGSPPRPQCDETGNYNPVQHSGSTGYSWCVDPATGAKIEGTESSPAAGPASCGGRQKRGLPGPCTAHQSAPGLIGAYVPQCTPFGFYQVIQTHASSGYKFCVNPETGAKAEGSAIPPSVGGDPTCGQCFYALARTLLAGPIGPVGMQRPQCDAAGNFNPLQRSGSTGYSWCVDTETGVKIEGTESSPAAGPAHCGGRQKRGLPGPCTAQQGKPGLIGAYVPQCTPFGFFQVVQTHASSGYRFCVNPETGVKAEGSAIPPSAGGDPTCGQCFYALARTLNAGPIGPVGMTRPKCDAVGNFKHLQSSGSTGYSWCVDPETGVKIEGTETSSAAGRAICDADRFKRAAGQCAQEVANVGDKAMPGYSKPQCTTKGNYQLIQYHASTGFSYCVNPDSGLKIDGTEVPPGENRRPACPACATLLAQGLERILVGAYRPQCDINGQFKKLQISASTGFAWCADPITGNKIAGTFQRYDGTQKCETVAAEEADDEPQGPCAAAAAQTQPLMGAYRPACDSRGFYASIQYHEGYRFCVDTNTGVQLPGSPSFGPGDSSKLPCEN